MKFSKLALPLLAVLISIYLLALPAIGFSAESDDATTLDLPPATNSEPAAGIAPLSLPPGTAGESAANPATDFAQLANAISVASAGDAIYISGSFTFTSALTVNKTLLFYGVSESQTVLTAAVGNRHFIVTGGVTATFNDITFQGPATPITNSPNGGIESANGCILSVSNCTFNANSYLPSGRGAGIYAYQAVLVDCTFTNNDAMAGGGACTDGLATLTNCRFEHNSGNDANGGGLSANGTTELTYCTFVDNQANVGGGVFLSGDSTLTECTFTQNSSLVIGGMGGGGVYGQSGINVTMIGCTVANNTAVSSGGGIYLNGSSIPGKKSVLENCLITDNETSLFGGGVYLSGSDNQVLNCTISGNTALAGGGISVIGVANEFVGCALVDNHADQLGGAIFISTYYSATLTNCTVSGNRSDMYVGAIYADDDAALTLTSCTVVANTAPTDCFGGIYLESDLLTLYGNIIAGNSDQQDITIADGVWASEVPSATNNYNLIGTSSGYTLPLLFGTTSPSATDNGGPTPTIALPAGSAALNVIPVDASTSLWLPTTDQRGMARPYAGGLADIGAFEAYLSNDAGLASVAGKSLTFGPESGTSLDPITAQIEVDNSVTVITLADIVATHPSSIVGLYSDSSFTVVGSVNLAVGPNLVYIKVTAEDGLTVVYYAVTVIRNPAPEPNTITLNKNTLSLEVDDDETLIATVTPAGSGLTVVWTSSDPSIATVDSNGSVTAVAVGSATITATIDGTEISDSCIVTVTAAVNPPPGGDGEDGTDSGSGGGSQSQTPPTGDTLAIISIGIILLSGLLGTAILILRRKSKATRFPYRSC